MKYIIYSRSILPILVLTVLSLNNKQTDKIVSHRPIPSSHCHVHIKLNSLSLRITSLHWSTNFEIFSSFVTCMTWSSCWCTNDESNNDSITTVWRKSSAVELGRIQRKHVWPFHLIAIHSHGRTIEGVDFTSNSSIWIYWLRVRLANTNSSV